MNSTLSLLINNLSQYENRNSFNSTKIDAPLLRKRQYEKIIIYSILFVIASIGNTTSFIALLFMNKERKKKNKSKSRIRILMMNLCMGDLMVAYIHLPLEIVWAITDSWLAGDAMCKLMMFLRTFGLYLSSFIIITITIDRYYAICKPMEFDFAFRLCKILLALSWIMSVFSSIPQVFVFEVLTHPKDPTFKQCVTFGKLNTVRSKLAYNFYHFMGCYGTPLLIMMFCYAKILATIAYNHDKASSSNNDSLISNKRNENSDINRFGKIKDERQVKLRCSKHNTFERAKYKTLKLSALIVVAFLFSWTPYYFCVMWATLDPVSYNNLVNKKVSNYLFTFSNLNSCFNPIIYGLFSNKLYKFLPCISNKNNKSI